MQGNMEKRYKIARNIMNARRAKVMTHENLAEKTDLNIEFLKSIEKIDPPMLSNVILEKIANALGVNLSDLIQQ